jgi:hypothetical protein
LPIAARSQQLANGTIDVTVTDSLTHQGLDNAEVFLLGGDTPQSSLTNAQGIVEFRDVAPGIYSVAVQRSDYKRSDVSEFEVAENVRVAVAVALESSLKVIASVTAHGHTSITSTDIDAESSERKVSQTLKGALAKIAGITIDDTTYGPGSAFNVSLRNHDASQTAYSVDGIRVGGGQSGLIGSAQSLFSGASVSFEPTAGDLGGTLNFQTLRPTKTWTYDALGKLGNYGAATYSFSVTGAPNKRIALAYQHAFDAQDDFRSGLTYADQSGGAPYLHVAANQTTGDLLKLSYTVNKRTSATITGILTNARYSGICKDFTTLVPCGFGSVPTSSSRNAYALLRIGSLIGNVEAGVYAGTPFGRYGQDASARIVDGTPMTPYVSTTNYRDFNIGTYASVTAKRHTDSFNSFFSEQGGTSTQTYNSNVLTIPQPVTRMSEIAVHDHVKSNDRLALTHGLSLVSGTDAGSALVASETADWQPAKADVFEASLSLGSAQPSYAGLAPFSDPLSADFDCFNGSTYVDGPADRAVKQSSVNYTFSWQRTFRGGNVKVDLFRENDGGQQLRVALPIAGETSTLFPNGEPAYLAQLQSVWSLPTVCGSIPFQPKHVYVSKSVSGLDEINQGFDISGRVPLGRNVVALPTYAVGSTYLTTIDPRLEFPGSYYATGIQLPHKPLRTAGLTIDGILPKARLELLGNAQFTSINNPGNLPAFTTYNAGVVFLSDTGTITLTESNIFGTRTGLFTRYQGVDPMPVVGGGTFSFATTPLPPRQWTITWNIPWHQQSAHGRLRR